MADDTTKPSKIIEGTAKTIKVVPNTLKRSGSLLRTATRLAVGTTLLATDMVVNQVRRAEEHLKAEGKAPVALDTQPQTAPPAADEVIIEVIDEQEVRVKSADKVARYALLGLVFDAQVRLEQGVTTLYRAEQTVSRSAGRVLRPLGNSKLLSPLRRRYENVTHWSQNRISQWLEIGQNEERYSRDLAQTTVNQLLETSLDYVGENPKIQEFVQETIQNQSLGLAEEAITEVRERTISSDLFLERIMRLLLRRPPRESLPPHLQTPSYKADQS